MYCLLCLENFVNGVEYIDAYSDEGIRLNVSNVINKHFWLQIGQSTKHICKVCWNAVNEFHSFYRRIVEVHQQLLINYMSSDKTPLNVDKYKGEVDDGGEQEVIMKSQGKSPNSFNGMSENPYNENGISDVFEPQIDIHEESIEDHTFEEESQKDLVKQTEAINDLLEPKVEVDFQGESMNNVDKRSLRSCVPNKLSNQIVKQEPPINFDDSEYLYETQEANEPLELQQNATLNCDLIENNSLGQSLYRCDSCNHVSTTASGLKRHKYFIHVCLKKYKCSMCTKAFKRKQYLTEHISVHTGVFLYSCTICETKFKAKSNLFHHLKRKHNTAAKDGSSKLFYTEINV